MVYGGDGEERGLNPRIILAVIIALIGIVGYYFNTQKNPVTGEVQHVALSVDEEKALGLEAAPEMAAKMGGALSPDRDPRARLVAEVGRRIIGESDANRSPYLDNFRFRLLDDEDTINAFALPGGPIFITAGLFDKLENEAQLAGVLGHEVGHVINRHSAEHMATGRLGQMLTGAVAVGASDDRGRGRMAAMAAMVANQMIQLKYSRSDESEADAYGLRYMTQAGYDPHAMLGVMRVLKEASKGQRQPEFLATHPLPQTRIDEIEQILRRDYPEDRTSSLTLGESLPGAR